MDSVQRVWFSIAAEMWKSRKLGTFRISRSIFVSFFGELFMELWRVYLLLRRNGKYRRISCCLEDKSNVQRWLEILYNARAISQMYPANYDYELGEQFCRGYAHFSQTKFHGFRVGIATFKIARWMTREYGFIFRYHITFGVHATSAKL